MLRKYAGQVEFLAPIKLSKKLALSSQRFSNGAKCRCLLRWQSWINWLGWCRPSKPRPTDDWPVLAAALALDCPIWTEDTDFFGYGVATWTTDRVGLAKAAKREQ